MFSQTQTRAQIMYSCFCQDGICLLPYPDGKTFAFTIVDDTDGATLESIRPTYEYLFSLGLRTTKTVWVRTPNPPPQRPADTGDTLEREEYRTYMQLLRQRGFEIALHNVSSTSNKRTEIAAGLDAFTRLMERSPKINVHHEKNLENMYFEFAQSGRHLPTPYRTALFAGIHRMLTRCRRQPKISTYGCAGENPRSEYFWGDLCKATIKYVRTNVFFQDLNTLKCSSLMPYALTETRYVNYWFDSSNGQDVHQFNSILSDKNIDRLRKERGCSILYTHFGRGFVDGKNGKFELNAETKQRLQSVAGHPQGWYAPVSEVLDRLLAFQRVSVLPVPGGILITNHNDFAVDSLTLHTAPGRPCCDPNGKRFTADRNGQVVISTIPARASAAILGRGATGHASLWYENNRHRLLVDLANITRKIGERLA